MPITLSVNDRGTLIPERNPARSILIIAVYETLDSIRSRRAIVLLLLYFAGSLLATNGVVSVVQEIEAQLLESL
jgi:hypothetical protein